ncbi:dynein beta chain, ciliary-like [Anneissia japonica]|nr:dynein beta chain, ciliary-like [Anneissia japonica]
MHESDRVYGDKFIDEKDIETFQKVLVDFGKKYFEDVDEDTFTKKPNIFCHFAGGIGDPKYLAVPGWDELSKILVEALDSHNEINAVMNLVLFEDAMQHV